MLLRERGDAVEMVVTGRWTRQAAETVRSGRVDRLVLNYALGFDEPTLGFLDGLPLRELVILDPRLPDLEPVYSLADTLQTLRLTTNPALDIDLARLPKVREVAAAWSQVSGSIDAAAALRSAFLLGYRPADLTPLGNLRHLTQLVMKDRPSLKTLTGLSQLPGLGVLEIYLAKNLSDISDLSGRSTLDTLVLQSCRKVERLDDIAECLSLRVLNVSECGPLESLDPLRGLTRLETVLAFGTTRVLDDDLTPLLGLPQLSELRFQSRKSYRPSVEDVRSAIRSRTSGPA